MKQCRLFCFVCHVEISQSMALHAMLLVSLQSSQWVWVYQLGLRLFEISQTMELHAMLLVSLQSSQWVRVHQLGLRLFVAVVWKLLIIESFSQCELNFWKLKTILEFGVLLVLLESPRQVRFNRVYFIIFRTMVWKIMIFEWVLLVENSNKLQKIGFGMKKSVEPSMCSHCWI